MNSDNSKPSLFSFQDIITSVIGIFIFISILLVLSISVETAKLIGEIEQGSEIEEMNLKDEIKQMHSINAILKKQKAQLLDRQDEYDDILKKTQALKEEIAAVEQEIDALKSINISTVDPTFMDEFVKEGQKRVKVENARTKAEIAKLSQTMDKLKVENAKLDTELAKYKDGVVFVNMSSALGSKNLLFVDASVLGFKIVGKESSFMNLARLEMYLSSLNKDSIFLQFLFRPSASHMYLEASKICANLSISYGASVILEGEYILNE